MASVASILNGLLNAYDNAEIDGSTFIAQAEEKLDVREANLHPGCHCNLDKSIGDVCNCDPHTTPQQEDEL